MSTNEKVTIYHKVNNTYHKFNYDNVWFFGGKGSNTNKGYVNANDVQIRVWYELNKDLNIDNFSIGDIVVKGRVNLDITRQQDLQGYEVYNITALVDNTYGNSKHIHISGR